MLEEYAGETADAVDEWLAALPQARTTERD
jgi:hypothetical protein